MDSKLRPSNSKFPADAKEVVAEALPDGLNNHMLCTSGIRNQKTGTFSVSANKERKQHVHILNLNPNFIKIQGPCKGDEGGPLYINGKPNSDGDIEGQTLVAIHSGSAGPCGRHSFPAWWTRVRNHIIS